jgi:integrase
MAVYQHIEKYTDKNGNVKAKKTWRFRKQFRIDGQLVKLSGTPQINTKEAAQAAERKAIEKAERGPEPTTQPAEEVTTFAAFADVFMATYVKTKNKPSEQAAKRSILDNHLLPAFGPKLLDAITILDVDGLKAKLLRTEENPQGLTAKRVNNILHVLSKLMKYAVKAGKLTVAPQIETLKIAPQRFDFFTFEEFETLVAAARQEPEWQAAILVAGEAGLRMGELLALRREDIDLANAQLVVMRTDWRGKIGSPKGGRERKVPLTSRLVEALRRIRHLRGELMFCWEDGTRWTFTTMRAGLKRQQKRAGLRVTGWHTLRHTFCSHLAMRGAAPKAIQGLAGHQSIVVTEKYMHIVAGSLRSAIDLLEPTPLQASSKAVSKVA